MYFISGIGPGEAGVSGFYSYIEMLASKKNVSCIYPYKHKAFKRLFYNNKIEALFYLLKISLYQLIFYIKILLLKPQKIILAHPQNIGLLLTIFIILRHKKINYYVLDNSYFCIKSYNYHQKEGECLRCLGMEKLPYADCKSFPGIRPRFLHIIFIKFLLKNNKKIKFFFQNELQLNLFKIHAKSKYINVQRIGLLTSDIKKSFDDFRKINLISKNKNQIKFDKKFFNRKYIVFHGMDHDAKGSKIAYFLAQKFPEYNFIFPYHKPSIILPENCFFVPCSWTSGLKEIIIFSDCVICSSIWSAPIEAALVKSILYNGLIIVSKNKYSFSAEIPNELLITYQNENSIKIIKDILNDNHKKNEMKRKLKSWVIKYFDKNNLESIFIFD